MCRGKDCCSALDKDSSKWDLYCPLRQPGWMNEQIDIFIDALNDFIQWDKISATEKIEKLRNNEIQTWYIEHGQMSGWHRNNILKIQPTEVIEKTSRDSLRSPKKYEKEVFLRDWYRCRYCENRIISQKFLKIFAKKMNSSSFKRWSTNLDTHGIIHLTWPVADHVIPWNLGGRTNPNNLVTCCASCNYWKAGYTLEQLGMENPFSRKPVLNEWDGLESKIKLL